MRTKNRGGMKKDCTFNSMSHHVIRKGHVLMPVAALITCLVVSGQTDPGAAELETLLPDPLVSTNGVRIGSAGEWEERRREEILELFRDQVYGRVPEQTFRTRFQTVYYNREALGGKAIMKEVNVTVSNGEKSLEFPILVFLPADREGPVPLFLGLNFYGNQSIHPDRSISITSSWVGNRSDWGITNNKAGESSRGVRAERWPVEMILERGYGLATIYAGDIDPDFDDGFRNGVHGLLTGEYAMRDEHSWGTLATWAWGLSRAMDYFETDPDVDPRRVAVIGHSRMGKAALWAGAMDQRFALVISNDSGCGGAALSMRKHGETVERINEVFPHWFAGAFKQYNNNESALPVDQHMLLSLVAPRPLYVASASEDDWADPEGEYLSLYLASRVYSLYGQEPLVEDHLPEEDRPVRSGKLGYHLRTGGHNLTRYDWEQYLGFADRFLGDPAPGNAGNPVTMEWIREHLRHGHPRVLITPEIEARVRQQLAAGDLTATTGLQLMHLEAASILEQEPLVRQKTGKRLLSVSREAVRRFTTLALLCRLDQREAYVQKLEEELTAVCGFSDWNPSHFLDVAEMAAGVALALDWAGEWLSGDVKALAREALVEKALKPSLANTSSNYWVKVNHNWNLVCHGGLSLAALTVFEQDSETCSRVLHRAVEYMPLALEPYGPDGIYPEGPSYWVYATTYLTLALSGFESALGTDFGFTSSPGVLESVGFSQVLAGPSGEYYDYFDASLEGFHSITHYGLLAWFATRSAPGYDHEAFNQLLVEAREHPRMLNSIRYFGCFYLNALLVDPDMETAYEQPSAWFGRGDEPIVIFRDPGREKEGFFLAAKGGRAADNHGNMDGGSFILELEGIRWSVDPGNQPYNELEQIMGNGLWDQSQDSPRWSLLTKNNLGHSTLTVNGAYHRAIARARLLRVDLRSQNPLASFDLTPLFGKNVERVVRTFSRVTPHTLRIVDDIEPSPQTRLLTWQLITRADIDVNGEDIRLTMAGKNLHIELKEGRPVKVDVAGLSPPPLEYDKNIPGLKRLEIHRMIKDPGPSPVRVIIDLSSD